MGFDMAIDDKIFPINLQRLSERNKWFSNKTMTATTVGFFPFFFVDFSRNETERAEEIMEYLILWIKRTWIMNLDRILIILLLLFCCNRRPLKNAMEITCVSDS